MTQAPTTFAYDMTLPAITINTNNYDDFIIWKKVWIILNFILNKNDRTRRHFNTIK